MSVMPFLSTLRNALLANGEGSASRAVTAAEIDAFALVCGALAGAAPRVAAWGVDASVVVGPTALTGRSFASTGMNQPIVARSGIRYFAATRCTSFAVTLFTEST